MGGWVLAGLLSFYVIEKLFGDKDEEEEEEEVKEVETVNSIKVETSSTASDDSCDGELMHRFARSIRRERSGGFDFSGMARIIYGGRSHLIYGR